MKLILLILLPFIGLSQSEVLIVDSYVLIGDLIPYNETFVFSKVGDDVDNSILFANGDKYFWNGGSHYRQMPKGDGYTKSQMAEPLKIPLMEGVRLIDKKSYDYLSREIAKMESSILKVDSIWTIESSLQNAKRAEVLKSAKTMKKYNEINEKYDSIIDSLRLKSISDKEVLINNYRNKVKSI